MSIAHDATLYELAQREQAAALRYPLSRWYLRPLAQRLAARLSATAIRPWHLTLLGVCASLSAAALLIAQPAWHVLAALLVLLAWFFDRADGLLARRQQTTSPLGAWLDANLDELADVALHVAIAVTLVSATGSALTCWLLVAFIAGKYLFMHGLSSEPTTNATTDRAGPQPTVRWLYHLPANADVRIHLLIAALALNLLTTELLIVALYYNMRWLARYVLVARRLSGNSP